MSHRQSGLAIWFLYVFRPIGIQLLHTLDGANSERIACTVHLSVGSGPFWELWESVTSPWSLGWQQRQLCNGDVTLSHIFKHCRTDMDYVSKYIT